jgi:hypothetical protein
VEHDGFGLLSQRQDGLQRLLPHLLCGLRQHAATDADGSFTIGGLSPDPPFTLLVVHDGYSALYVKKVNPAEGPAATAVLKPRPPIDDVSQVVRGRVVDVHSRLCDVAWSSGVTYR